jgi:hypothetical protein
VILVFVAFTKVGLFWEVMPLVKLNFIWWEQTKPEVCRNR